jgi:hypothetical protein
VTTMLGPTRSTHTSPALDLVECRAPRRVKRRTAIPRWRTLADVLDTRSATARSFVPSAHAQVSRSAHSGLREQCVLLVRSERTQRTCSVQAQHSYEAGDGATDFADPGKYAGTVRGCKSVDHPGN